jgi:hypothetical protein
MGSGMWRSTELEAIWCGVQVESDQRAVSHAGWKLCCFVSLLAASPTSWPANMCSPTRPALVDSFRPAMQQRFEHRSSGPPQACGVLPISAVQRQIQYCIMSHNSTLYAQRSLTQPSARLCKLKLSKNIYVIRSGNCDLIFVYSGFLFVRMHFYVRSEDIKL